MKIITGYESSEELGAFDERSHGYPSSPFGQIEAALRRLGITPRQAIRNNELQPLAKVGDYHYSGGGFKIAVPDDFQEAK